jgi:spermidine synthase
MLPWIQIDTAKIPGGEELRLKRRGLELSIMLGSNELMNSRLSGSEEALASLSIEKISGRPRQRILIGGLGMGFTLRAALSLASPAAEITVVELLPAVVAWAKGPMAELHGTSLGDIRVKIIENDVAAVIAAARQAYDAILLDVDNGPDGLSRPGNDGLYSLDGLAAARAALSPGGVLAVWSAHPDPAFARRLKQAGFAAEEKPVRAHGKSGARHMIWLGVKP